jgi:hypothetical protein
MRKQAFTLITILGLLLITWLPCHAEDNVIYGCAKKKNGQLRLVSNPSKCLKSEYAVTLNGTSSQNQNPLPNFEGDLCWGNTNEPGSIMKLGVSYIGDGHFLVTGKINRPDGSVHNVVNGNAEIDSGNIYMTLAHSGKDSDAMWAGIIHVILDSSTLNGVAEAISHDRDYSEIPVEIGDIYIDSDTQHSTASVTFIPCP